MNHKAAIYLLLLGVVFSSSGASCPWVRQQMDPVPVAFTAPPTLEQVIETVNQNTASVQRLETSGATVAAQGFPGLRADLAIERPRRLRLRARLMGTSQLDLGSNDEVFWIWARPFDPPALYYARHDQFAASAAREILPVPPHWLTEALGLVTLDPAADHEGPYQDGPGRLKIITHLTDESGQRWTRALVIHDTYGWILQQELFDQSGRLAALATASEHRHYPLEDVSLPHQVELELHPPANSPVAEAMKFRIQVNSYVIGSLSADPEQLWAMPHTGDTPHVDLASPGVFARNVAPPAYPAVSQIPLRTGSRPRYRGLD